MLTGHAPDNITHLESQTCRFEVVAQAFGLGLMPNKTQCTLGKWEGWRNKKGSVASADTKAGASQTVEI